jgi:O-glycosyl hydrolase
MQVVRPTLEALEHRRLLATVTLDMNQPWQTIDSIGGNYCRANFAHYVGAQEAIGQYTVDHLDPRIVRVPIIFKQWEPTNDNADPAAINMAGFTDTGEVTEVFQLMKQFQDQGRTIIASAWDAPDWMVSNPANVDQRIVPAAMWGELAESMAAFVKRAKDAYGVTINYLSFNEANGGYKLLFTAAEHADFIEMAGKRLDGLGLTGRKWLVGDTYRVRDSVPYMKAILDDAGAKPYLGPISFHTWWSESIPQSEWSALADLAAQYGKPLWSAEIGAVNGVWKTPEVLETWDYAVRTALTYHKTLAWARANAALYWQYQDDFRIMSLDTTDQFLVYHVIKQLRDGLPTGAQLVSAASDDSSLYALAARDIAGDGLFVQVINNTSSDKPVTFSGLPSNMVTVLRTSSVGEESAVVGTPTPTGGKLSLTLKAQSVTVLKAKLGMTNTTLRAGDDATVRGGTYATANYGAATTLEGKTSGSASNLRESYLKFGLGSSGVIGSARLRLYGQLSDTTDPAVVSGVFTAASTTWSENTITFNTRPARSSSPLASQPITGTAGRWYEFDVTGYVQARKLAGASAVSFVLANPGTSTSRTVFSSDEAATAKPQLLIQRVVIPSATVLRAGNDAIVRGGTYASTNYGAGTTLESKTAGTASNTRESYLRFDISSLVAASITSVKLRLYGNLSDTANASVGVGIYSAASTAWNEGAINFANRPARSASPLASQGVSGTTARWYEFDVTAYVKAQRLAGATAITLVIANPAVSTSRAVFSSDEAATARPELVIS